MGPVVFLWIVSDAFQVCAHLMVGNQFGWFDGVECKLAPPVTPLISFVFLLCGIARPRFALFVVSL